MSTETTTARAAMPLAARQVRIRRALVVAGAVVAALAVWTLAGPVAGIDLAVESNGTEQTVGAGAVVAGSLISGLMAWASLAVLERFLRRPVRAAWAGSAVVATVLSVGGPLGATDTASVLALIGMHVAVAAVLIPGLARSRPACQRRLRDGRAAGPA